MAADPPAPRSSFRCLRLASTYRVMSVVHIATLSPQRGLPSRQRLAMSANYRDLLSPDERKPDVLRSGGARMALLDIESGFWALRRQTEARTGARRTDDFCRWHHRPRTSRWSIRWIS